MSAKAEDRGLLNTWHTGTDWELNKSLADCVFVVFSWSRQWPQYLPMKSMKFSLHPQASEFSEKSTHEFLLNFINLVGWAQPNGGQGLSLALCLGVIPDLLGGLFTMLRIEQGLVHARICTISPFYHMKFIDMMLRLGSSCAQNGAEEGSFGKLNE